MHLVVRHLRLLTMLGVIAAWGVRLAMSGQLYADADVHYVPSSPTVEASVTPSHLLEAHGCWRGQAPADMRNRLPRHVVVTTRTGRTVYGGPALVGQALDQQFAHKPAGLTIHGFCR